MFRYGYGFGCGLLGRGGGWIGMMIIALVLIGLAVYFISRLPRNESRRDYRETDNSIEILNERLARGEISEDEYKQKKSLLLKR